MSFKRAGLCAEELIQGAVGSTHVRFGHAGGILDLAKEHLHLVHAPAPQQLFLLGAEAVLDRIIGLQQHVFTLGLLQVEVRARISLWIRA